MKQLLRQNAELRKVGVFNWTLPAHVVTLSDGSRFNTCPHAGACGRICYAKFGTFQFPAVKASHLANLEFVLNDPDGWQTQINEELLARRFRQSGQPHDLICDETDPFLVDWIMRGGKAVRIHDSGDFFAWDYLMRWSKIAETNPSILFYAYTKEISMIQEFWLTEQAWEVFNLRFIFSYGGTEDHLIDRDRHRHSDVFPDLDTLLVAGYTNQSDSDLIAVTAPTTRIGIVQNNLPIPKRRLGEHTLSGLNHKRYE